MVESTIDDLRKLIARLIAQYENAEKERLSLERQLQTVSNELDSSKKQIKEMLEQIDVLRLREAFTTETTNTTAAKEKIDSLVSEIDRCLNLLEK